MYPLDNSCQFSEQQLYLSWSILLTHTPVSAIIAAIDDRVYVNQNESAFTNADWRSPPVIVNSHR